MTLSEFLTKAGLSQAKFAAKIGVHPITVNKWASGKAIPRREHIAEVARTTSGAVTAADWFHPGDAPSPASSREAVS